MRRNLTHNLRYNFVPGNVTNNIKPITKYEIAISIADSSTLQSEIIINKLTL